MMTKPSTVESQQKYIAHGLKKSDAYAKNGVRVLMLI